MLFKRDESSKVGDRASIQVPVKSSKAGCTLRLWYWLSNSFYAELGVFYRETIGERWTNIYETVNPTLKWTRIDIKLPELENFQVRIDLELIIFQFNK